MWLQSKSIFGTANPYLSSTLADMTNITFYSLSQASGLLQKNKQHPCLVYIVSITTLLFRMLLRRRESLFKKDIVYKHVLQ